MASTNKTKNYKLNQWLGSDYMKRDDLNNDNELIDAALKYNADALSTEAAARSTGDSALRDLVSSEAAARQAADEEINSMIKSGVTMSPTIGLGMNSVIRKTDGITSFPKFTIQGKSYVNLLGKDGNCEDVGKWLTWQSANVLDSTNKVFGSNGFKITTSATLGAIYKILSSIPTFTPSKYYFASAFLKNGNALFLQLIKDASNGGMAVSSAGVSDNTKFTRVGIKLGQSSTSLENSLGIFVSGTSGQYGYVDGIMVMEITETEYSVLSETQLLEKYPYVDSYACVQNPYIEVRHDNLVRNGNCEEGIAWWYLSQYSASQATIISENGKFKVSHSNVGQPCLISQTVKLKRNTNYYLTGNITGGTTAGKIGIRTDTTWIYQQNKSGIFNSGDNDFVYVCMRNDSDGYCYYDSLRLIEGTTAPASYKHCRIERCMIEGKLTSDDTISFENGKVSGLLNWRHRTLYGKDYDWQYSADFPGYKRVFATYCPNNYASSYGADRTVRICAKYDGKLLDVTDGATPDACVAFGSGSAWDGEIYIRTSDTDTGWTETINPNADEVKAFMNGWKSLGNDGVARYALWGSVLHSDYHVNIEAFPPNTATTLASATNGTSSFTVTNASIFKVGDPIAVFGNSGVTITAISGNTLTVSGTQAVQPAGRTVVRIDFPPNDTRIITYCKNNIAPKYEGYQLHYKLQNPESITDSNVYIHGDIPKLDKGDNYLCIDSGKVLGEPIIPKFNNSNYIFGYAGYFYDIGYTPLKYKQIPDLDFTATLYKNYVYDSLQMTGTSGYPADKYVYLTPVNYDTNATYTVDYQILKNLHTTPASITMQYQQDMLSAVSDLAEAVNSRQKADSVMDMLVDFSVYESHMSAATLVTRGCYTATYGSATVLLAMRVEFSVLKKAVPIISLCNVGVTVKDSTGANIIVSTGDISSVQVNTVNTRGFSFVVYLKPGTTAASNAMNYGCAGSFGWIADCRGRL